jgi:alkane 1-monooxygenase
MARTFDADPHQAPGGQADDQGVVDPIRWLRALTLLIPALACVGVALLVLTGWTWGAWLTPILVFCFVPLLDWWIGADRRNPPEEAVAALEADPYYRWLLLAQLPLQLAVTVGGCWAVARLDPGWGTLVGLWLTVGGANGFAIVAAHEAGHKRGAGWRWLALLKLAPSAYGHFVVEHNRGHHRRVATPEDPASARMGESFWRFLPRSVAGGLASAWRLERQRLAAGGVGAVSRHNHVLQGAVLTCALWAGLLAWLGWGVLPFLVAQAVYAFSLLEVVNYLEHYGLLRAGDGRGGYVRCSPEHSWNSNHVVSNLLLYQLQRHSDHHAHATRSWQALRHFDSSPQLPSGYASMLMLAYWPRLWFKVMDARVARHYGGDLARANLHPAARERLLARWHRPAAGAAD